MVIGHVMPVSTKGAAATAGDLVAAAEQAHEGIPASGGTNYDIPDEFLTRTRYMFSGSLATRTRDGPLAPRVSGTVGKRHRR